MIALLDTVGPAVLRASWQAAVLAVAGHLLVRSLGRTHFATLALSSLERRHCPAAFCGDSSESVERV